MRCRVQYLTHGDIGGESHREDAKFDCLGSAVDAAEGMRLHSGAQLEWAPCEPTGEASGDRHTAKRFFAVDPGLSVEQRGP